MDEWVKWVLSILCGIGAWSLTVYFAKGWFEERVLKRLDAFEKKLTLVGSAASEAGSKADGAAFKILTANAELRNDWSKEQVKLSGLFIEATKYSTAAEHQSRIAVDKAQELEKVADMRVEQAKAVGRSLQSRMVSIENEEKKMKTEIQTIKDDLFIVKEKK